MFADNVKNLLRNERSFIEKLQLSVVSGIAGLMYSEYIRNFQQRLKPTRKIFVPELNLVKNIIDKDSEYMKYISDNVIGYIKKELINMNLIDEYPYSIVNKYSEELSVILELHIIPNVARTIPRVIAAKFSLNDDNNQTYVEDPEIKFFNNETKLDDDYLRFTLDQIFYNLIVTDKEINKSIDMVENNNEFRIDFVNMDCLSISNDNAITTLYFNNYHLNSKIIDLFKFITGSKFEKIENSSWNCSSIPFNTIMYIYFPNYENK